MKRNDLILSGILLLGVLIITILIEIVNFLLNNLLLYGADLMNGHVAMIAELNNANLILFTALIMSLFILLPILIITTGFEIRNLLKRGESKIYLIFNVIIDGLLILSIFIIFLVLDPLRGIASFPWAPFSAPDIAAAVIEQTTIYNIPTLLFVIGMTPVAIASFILKFRALRKEKNDPKS